MGSLNFKLQICTANSVSGLVQHFLWFFQRNKTWITHRFAWCLIIAIVTGFPTAPVLAQDTQSDVDSKIAALEKKFGIQVHYRFDAESFFPARWMSKPISAQGGPIEKKEVSRLVPLIDRFLSRYPKKVLDSNLENIYLNSKLQFYGKNYGATNSRTGLYITSKGRKKGYTDEYLVRTMHSEFSSILMRNYDFPKIAWRNVNSKDFKYVGSGTSVLGQPGLFKESNELHSQGFVVRYAQSSLENDFNMIASRLFTEREKMKRLSGEYPRINAKIGLAIQFYKSVHPELDFE